MGQKISPHTSISLDLASTTWTYDDYCKEGRPAWWPRKPRWSELNLSNATKSECTLLIKKLNLYYGIDPAMSTNLRRSSVPFPVASLSMMQIL